MDNMLKEFLDKTMEEVLSIYNEDGFRDGFAEAIEAFKDAVFEYFEENLPEDIYCDIFEYDEDYDSPPKAMNNLLEMLKSTKLDNFYYVEFMDVHFYIMLLKKGE